MSLNVWSTPDESIPEGGIAVEQEVIAEPANGGANQAVPEMRHEELEGCAIVASCLTQ